MRSKQINESRKFIIDGFLALLEEKNYNDITMSDIAKRSMVSRMTLYRHFDEKEKILKYYVEETIIAEVKEKFTESKYQNMEVLLLLRNQVIYTNQHLRFLLSNEDTEIVLSEIVEMNQNMFIKFLPNQKDVSLQRRLFVAGGIEYLTKEWIKNGMKESPENITNEIMSIIKLLEIL